MKKILFVIFTENFSWGVSILASLSQKCGWRADILFLPRESTEERFISCVQDFCPNVVAISFMSYDRRLAFMVARLAKSMGLKVIAGGVHPTFLPQDVALTGLFDGVVAGDGMGILTELLDGIDCIGKESPVILAGKRHPDRSLYTSLYYSSSQIKRMEQTRSAMLLSSQGCPFKCRFCASGALDYLAYSPEEIVRMLERLYMDHGVNNFQFFDDLFAQSANRCRSIHQAVVTRFGADTDIKYGNFVQARVSTFNEAIAEELVRMKIAYVNFGIETASPRLLKFLNKKQTRQQCYDAMRICKDFGLIRKVNLMFGLPTQDREDYETTLQFVEETKPEIKTCFFYVPMPGSNLYDYCFDHGYLPAHYNRHRYDWFEDRPDGFVDIQCRLQNVDYDLALTYKERIGKSDDQIEYLASQVRLIDDRPWVILGTSKTFYFKKFIERLATMELRHCLGYIDVEEDGGFAVDGTLCIRPYDTRNHKEPQLCATYCYLGSDDYKFMQRVRERYFGDIPLISMASYKNHSLSEISEIISQIKRTQPH